MEKKSKLAYIQSFVVVITSLLGFLQRATTRRVQSKEKDRVPILLILIFSPILFPLSSLFQPSLHDLASDISTSKVPQTPKTSTFRKTEDEEVIQIHHLHLLFSNFDQFNLDCPQTLPTLLCQFFSLSNEIELIKKRSRCSAIVHRINQHK